MIIDGYRDAPWGWFIYDVCVALRRGTSTTPRPAASATSSPRPASAPWRRRSTAAPPVLADGGHRRRTGLGDPRAPLLTLAGQRTRDFAFPRPAVLSHETTSHEGEPDARVRLTEDLRSGRIVPGSGAMRSLSISPFTERALPQALVSG